MTDRRTTDAAYAQFAVKPDAACTCGHPFTDHRTPGAECVHSSEPGVACGCVTFREPTAAWREDYDAMRRSADRVRLDALLDSFRLYIDTPEAWSDRDMRTYRRLFAEHGVAGLHADDLIAAAEEALK